MARHTYGEELALVRSAGFLRTGDPSPKLLIQALQEIGVDGSYHRSNEVDPVTLDAADLVLTMEGEHVQRATLLHREAFPKIMPLTEAVEVAQGLGPVCTVGDLIGAVNDQRDPTLYLTDEWDVADPYNRKLKDYRRAVGEISGLVEELFTRLL